MNRTRAVISNKRLAATTQIDQDNAITQIHLARHPVVDGFCLLLRSAKAQNRREPVSQPKYSPVTEYDPKRDAAQDIQEAINEAQRTNKRILLEVGGEWCGWCHTLDRFFQANPDLLLLRDKNFVMVKINFSEDNQNKELLGHYPPTSGYPHMEIGVKKAGGIAS